MTIDYAIFGADPRGAPVVQNFFSFSIVIAFLQRRTRDQPDVDRDIRVAVARLAASREVRADSVC
ncbi:MAG: hypothetical protein JXR83_08445 [Deltaproteobacteria bacterium]|nr:hypothetical protein [Deltaproteobacteria bacterium]